MSCLTQKIQKSAGVICFSVCCKLSVCLWDLIKDNLEEGEKTA